MEGVCVCGCLCAGDGRGAQCVQRDGAGVECSSDGTHAGASSVCHCHAYLHVPRMIIDRPSHLSVFAESCRLARSDQRPHSLTPALVVVVVGPPLLSYADRSNIDETGSAFEHFPPLSPSWPFIRSLLRGFGPRREWRSAPLLRCRFPTSWDSASASRRRMRRITTYSLMRMAWTCPCTSAACRLRSVRRG